MDFSEYLCKRIRNGRRLAPNSISSHIQTWRIFQAWYTAAYNESCDPGLLTNYDMLQFRHWSIDIMRVKAATWNLRRAGLVLVCEWQGHPELMEGIELQASTDTEIKWLDDTQFGRVARQLERLPKAALTPTNYREAVRNRAALGLMLFAGLRVSEVANLRKSDIVINERSGYVIIHNGKGGKDGKVVLSLTARKAISEWLDMAGERLFPITTHQLGVICGQVCQAAGVPGVTCHQLRHTCLKRTLDGKNSKGGNPVPISVVQQIARHARIDTTLRYVQPSWADMETALSA